MTSQTKIDIKNKLESLKGHLSKVTKGAHTKGAPRISMLLYREGLDSEGEPALWVWLVPQNPTKGWSRKDRSAMKNLAFTWLQAELGEFDVWPYVRFMDPSEASEVSEAKHGGLLIVR